MVRSRARRRYLNEILKARYLFLDDAARFEVDKRDKESASLVSCFKTMDYNMLVSWAAGPDESLLLWVFFGSRA